MGSGIPSESEPRAAPRLRAFFRGEYQRVRGEHRRPACGAARSARHIGRPLANGWPRVSRCLRRVAANDRRAACAPRSLPMVVRFSSAPVAPCFCHAAGHAVFFGSIPSWRLELSVWRLKFGLRQARVSSGRPSILRDAAAPGQTPDAKGSTPNFKIERRHFPFRTTSSAPSARRMRRSCSGNFRRPCGSRSHGRPCSRVPRRACSSGTSSTMRRRRCGFR